MSEKLSTDLAGFLSPIKYEGADAAAFLHGQFTTDVTGLAPGRACLSAWCDAKGRAIATFILARQDEAFLLLAPDDIKETFVKRLKMFVLRSDVAINNADEEDIPQFPHLPGTDGDLSETALIRQGIPLLHPGTSGRFLPQELNLDKLDAVSFTKGCYPGQEIIARLRYRGAVKRRLCHATTDNSILLAPGAGLVAGRGRAKYRHSDKLGNRRQRPGITDRPGPSVYRVRTGGRERTFRTGRYRYVAICEARKDRCKRVQSCMVAAGR